MNLFMICIKIGFKCNVTGFLWPKQANQTKIQSNQALTKIESASSPPPERSTKRWVLFVRKKEKITCFEARKKMRKKDDHKARGP